jgi:rhomboid family GlyGly-CTERM serine protease
VNASSLQLTAARRIRQRLGPWVPVLALATLVLGLGLGGEAARLALRYEREALEAGELWRLFTGHLVHLGWGHLAMNVLALIVIRLLIADALGWIDWVATAVVAALGIAAGLYYFSPGVHWYVGLSGVLHGFIAAGALVLLALSPALGGILGGGLVVKLLLEQAAGPLPLSESAAGGDVIVAAHLYGAAAGAAYGALRSAARRRARAASL